jgi:hypothetical protein
VTRRQPRLLALVATLLVLTSCRLDATVSIVMAGDGTGTVTITAVADAELAGEVPDLAEELELRDASDAGWTIEGPSSTDDGGLTITLTHAFRDAAEATALLSSIGGPFSSMAVTRRVDGVGVEASATNSIGGTLVLRRGFAGFADQQLIEAVGGTPFGDRLGSTTPESAMSVRFVARLPGDVTAANGERDDGAITWDVPLDGTERSVEMLTFQAAPERNTWAGPLSITALVALVVWVVSAVAFIGYVITARRRRAALRRR